jgi:hypothetical protein
MIRLSKVIKTINPNAEFTYQEEDINSIQWLNGTTPISKADIEAQLPIVEFDSQLNLRNGKAKVCTFCT